jgi:hypothetical protein
MASEELAVEADPDEPLQNLMLVCTEDEHNARRPVSHVRQHET